MAGLQPYRQTTIGDCLDEALDEMVTAGKIPGDLATKMMAEVCGQEAAFAACHNSGCSRCCDHSHLCMCLHLPAV